MRADADIVVVGAGIVGLATAWQLRESHRVIVVEKEAAPALHQTGRNSGVIHSGIYYRPGSAKALMCRKGRQMLEKFCHDRDIPWRRSGKIIAATEPEEEPRLVDLAERGERNGLEGLEILDRSQIRTMEPAVDVRSGLHVRETGLVDFRAVTNALARDLVESGGMILTSFDVVSIENGRRVEIVSRDGRTVSAEAAVVCAGLHSDRLARLAGADPQVTIVPFRGIYYRVINSGLVTTPIYPVPDPRFPFLGVHLTPGIHGDLEAGPNAVLATGREGYRFLDVNTRDLAEIARFPGFTRLARRYWRIGAIEMRRSASRHVFASDLRRFTPSLRDEWLVPAGSGIRAQALDREGNLVDDFAFDVSGRILHVLNAPSPAATASLAIGDEIASRVTRL